MLKRDITYENFEGQTVTETFYFNLSKTEIVQLEVDHEGGLEAALTRIIESQDRKALISEFQKLVLTSYGVKSEDGKRFIKSDQLREEFSQTAAYDSLFMELATNADAAANFIKGVMPRDLSREIEKAELANQPPTLPFPPPPAA